MPQDRGEVELRRVEVELVEVATALFKGPARVQAPPRALALKISAWCINVRAGGSAYASYDASYSPLKRSLHL